jgi:hypothetical protein
MAKSRSAESTIIGYYYQFDYFILKLLQCQNDSDSVTIEGIEDVDLKKQMKLQQFNANILLKQNIIIVLLPSHYATWWFFVIFGAIPCGKINRKHQAIIKL